MLVRSYFRAPLHGGKPPKPVQRTDWSKEARPLGGRIGPLLSEVDAYRTCSPETDFAAGLRRWRPRMLHCHAQSAKRAML